MKHGHAKTTDRPATTEYAAWARMISRCGNPEARGYRNYGGRGISVCSQWRDDFTSFLEDVGARPSPDHSLDRYPDNDGNYEPGNVRWATRDEQANNKRTTVRLTLRGETMALTEWARHLGIEYTTLRSRFHKGWSVEDMLTRPKRGRARLASA